MIRALGLLGALTLATACYQEVTDFRDGVKADDDNEVSECRVSKRSGCFQGQVTSAQGLRIKGKEYFDADSLRILFKDLLVVKNEAGLQLTNKEYDLKLLEQFDNNSFASNMQVHVKGDYAKSAKVMRSGRFAIHNLPQGEYDVRAQKTIQFEVTYTTEGAVKEDGTAGEPKVSAKIFCATLYSDSSVEILNGRATAQVFDEYDVYMIDHECEKAQPSNSLSL